MDEVTTSIRPESERDQLKTILNRVQRHKSFVYGAARFLDRGAGLALEIDIQPRANGRPLCSGCEHSKLP